MNYVAIRTEGLGKEYRLGAGPARYKTLRDSLVGMVRRARRPVGGGEPFWALKDVSFEIRHGDVVGIVGRNGSGKSTLLKILSRVTEPTAGAVEVRGRVGTLLEVGTGFHPELTGRENIFLNGAILGMRRAEIARKFGEIVAFAEVEKFLDTPVKHYSSGMYVRLAFAVAAHLESEVLFVDEVLAVGDVQFQRRCLGRMSELARAGRTVLFVSHNIGVVRSLCTRGLWLSSGQLVEYGPVGEVTNRYLQSILANKDQTVDLTRATRWVAHPRCRITKLEVNDGHPVQHGDPVRVAVSFEAVENVFGVAVGVGFATVDGVRIMTTDTDLDGTRHDFPKGTRGVVRLTIDPILLQPGVYMLDLGVRTGDTEALDYIPACARVEVLPGPKTPTAIIRTDGNGGVRQPAAECRWDLGAA